jgi:hypothetical protein
MGADPGFSAEGARAENFVLILLPPLFVVFCGVYGIFLSARALAPRSRDVGRALIDNQP